jgi:hypothetical protein
MAVVIAIISNTLILACDRWPIPATESAILEYANFIFGWFFVLEMVLKVLGLGGLLLVHLGRRPTLRHRMASHSTA